MQIAWIVNFSALRIFERLRSIMIKRCEKSYSCRSKLKF